MAVLSVSTWTPADAAVVSPGSGVVVDFAAAGSSEQETVYEDQADFDAGSHTDTEALTNALTLATATEGDTFAAGTPGVAPSGWTKLSTLGSWLVQDRAPDRLLEYQTSNVDSVIEFDGYTGGDDQVALARCFSGAGGGFGVCVRLTGNGASTRGYLLHTGVGNGYLNLYRLTGDNGAATLLYSQSHGLTISASTWYWVKARVVGSSIQGKIWAGGSSEPGYLFTQTNTLHATGGVGLFADSSASNPAIRYDDFECQPVPAVYAASGSWISDNVDTSPVGRYSTGLVEWDETVPAGTTVAVELRWNGGAWQICTNGSPPPGITYDQDMTAGSGFEDVDFRVTFTTSDTSTTPSVDNLRLYFVPFDSALVTLTIAGEACTEADGRLDVWGDRQVSGGSPLIAWDDLHASASPWWYGGPGETVAVTLNYDGTTIDSISLEVETLTWGDHLPADCTFAMPTVTFETAPARLQWTAQGNAIGTERICQWHVLDKGMAIHADCKYYVAHVQIDDIPGEVIAAVPNPQDFPGEVIVYGWQRDDHPGELLVQGYRIDDLPGEVIPALRRADDFAGAIIVGTRRLDDHPGEVVVYGVNRNNVLEVRIVDETTWAAMVAAGYGVS